MISENRAGEESAAKARNLIGLAKPRKEPSRCGEMDLAANVWMRRSSDGGIGGVKIKGSDGCCDGLDCVIKNGRKPNKNAERHIAVMNILFAARRE